MVYLEARLLVFPPTKLVSRSDGGVPNRPTTRRA